MKITDEESKQCKICNESFSTSKYKMIHVKRVHKLSFKDYILLVYYNNQTPLCKCGCGTKLTFKANRLGPFFSEYTKNHWKHKQHTEKQIDKIKENTAKSIKKIFGVDNVFRLEFIKKKIKQSKLEKYGNANYNNIEKNIESQHKKFFGKIINSDRLKNKVIPLFTEKDYKGVGNLYDFQCVKCKNIFQDHLNNGRIPRCKKCYPDDIRKSGIETEIYTFLRNNTKYKILSNNRRLIKNHELDIFIPEKNIAIEFNGLYWHSELNGKNKNYHLNKTKLCEEKNIHLIQIFEDEWINKPDIIKKKLIHILNEDNTDKIYAKKTIVREISSSEKNDFLQKNHIQGEDKSKVKLGAFYNNQLIAVMTFGNLRIALGQSKQKGEYELIRFATSAPVIGIASKLLKYFIGKYNPKKIISYADRRWTYSKNNLYEKIGFKKVGETSPNYWYIKDNIRIHRFNFRKSVQEKKIEIFDRNLTEWQNMQLNGYNRIWDCGSLKYEMIISR